MEIDSGKRDSELHLLKTEFQGVRSKLLSTKVTHMSDLAFESINF
jgi:hypothetical protein